jgi:ribosomal protein S18 acetylase RimI-like enzyme
VVLSYRPAEKADSERIAELISLASDGVVDFLFHDLIPHMTPVQMVAYNLAQDHYPHSFQSAIVALNGKDIVGMALSYPSSYHKITDEMRDFFPAERLDHLHEFYSVKIPRSWFLDALAVEPTFRRQGIGARLVELTKQSAKENGYQMCSLIAFRDNSPALALYKGLGFRQVAHIHLAANEYISHADGCALLTCQMSG